jgi:hypothetical protein
LQKEIHTPINREPTMNGQEVFVPIIFFLSVAGIWGFIILTRHKERIMMIEKGLPSEDVKAMYARTPWKLSPLTSLKWGLVFVSIGIAVLVGMHLRATYSFEEGIYPGLMCLFGGLALIIFYLLAQRKMQ